MNYKYVSNGDGIFNAIANINKVNINVELFLMDF